MIKLRHIWLLLALLMASSVAPLLSQQPTEQATTDYLALPAGVWREFELPPDSVRLLFKPETIRQVIYHDAGSFTAIYKTGSTWYRIFVSPSGKPYYSVYMSHLRRRP